MNTRFGEYLGSMAGRQREFPPDVVTTESLTPIKLAAGSCVGGQSLALDFNWNTYQQAVANGSFNYSAACGCI